MPKLNLLVFLNAYEDFNPSNDPSRSNFKWDREINGLSVKNPLSNGFCLAPGETKTLFSGTRTLSQDNTTEYSLALVPLSTQTYQLSAISGTLPNFRTPRTTGADATTQVNVTQNGPLLTFTSTAGTNFNFSGVQVGDFVRIGTNFNIVNQGEYKILALTTTSFTIANDLGVPEGPITLGSGFATQVQIYSAAGVQVGDKLVISGGFSVVTQGTYVVTAVAANWVQFYTTDILPQEGPITTEGVTFYSMAKQFVYLESDQICSVLLNGSMNGQVSPLEINNNPRPGILMNTGTFWSMTVTNTSTDTANLFLASAE